MTQYLFSLVYNWPYSAVPSQLVRCTNLSAGAADKIKVPWHLAPALFLVPVPLINLCTFSFEPAPCPGVFGGPVLVPSLQRVPFPLPLLGLAATLLPFLRLLLLLPLHSLLLCAELLSNSPSTLLPTSLTLAFLFCIFFSFSLHDRPCVCASPSVAGLSYYLPNLLGLVQWPNPMCLFGLELFQFAFRSNPKFQFSPTTGHIHSHSHPRGTSLLFPYFLASFPPPFQSILSLCAFLSVLCSKSLERDLELGQVCLHPGPESLRGTTTATQSNLTHKTQSDAT